MAGHLRSAAGLPPDGQATGGIGLLGAGRESFLSRQESADGRGRFRDADPAAHAARPGVERNDADDHAKAFIAWLDQQPSVAKNRKVGTQGYCMGGPIAFRTSAAVPDRVGAVASFHGGGLVTKEPNSPHLQAAKTKASFLVAIAANDDTRAPNDKTVLKETFEKAKLNAEIEVYADALHGWCPPDSTVYSEPKAEKAWSRLLALYGKALA